MKLLMLYCTRFSYTPKVKNLEDVPEVTESKEYENSLVCFIQMEEQDLENPKKKETKLVKNIKWGAKKNDTRKVVLHSFAHLSTSKAPAADTLDMLNRVEERLLQADYQAEQTPFGYFLDIDVQAPGYSTARIFLDF